MGKDVVQAEFTRRDRMRYRQKLRRCLDTFAKMLSQVRFDGDRMLTGLEIELNLVDELAGPAMVNSEVLGDLEDPAFQVEMGRFNLELNVAPRLISHDGLIAYEQEILARLLRADERASRSHAQVALIGILPTLTAEQAVFANISANPRYFVLNEQIIGARGEDMVLDIEGVERLSMSLDSIAAEAACTAVQFHIQVAPDQFADYWNASQAIAAVQVAVGANSPFLFGRRLWDETRIALFQQSTDTRPDELKAQGVRPRVWFGERWISSSLDLFVENVKYFSPLLPVCEEEEPGEVLAAGGIPQLAELRLHNGTVYRWNRPVYDIGLGGQPHLRVENRVLPSGPTVIDTIANAALYFGLTRSLVEDEQPLWSTMPFEVAERNFYRAARQGIGTILSWPGAGDVPVTGLVLDELLPRAYAGLDLLNVAPAIRDRLLGVIEGRCKVGSNGASWQVRAASRPRMTLAAMLRQYRELMHSNVPTHEWPT